MTKKVSQIKKAEDSEVEIKQQNNFNDIITKFAFLKQFTIPNITDKVASFKDKKEFDELFIAMNAQFIDIKALSEFFTVRTADCMDELRKIYTECANKFGVADSASVAIPTDSSVVVAPTVITPVASSAIPVAEESVVKSEVAPKKGGAKKGAPKKSTTPTVAEAESVKDVDTTATTEATLTTKPVESTPVAKKPAPKKNASKKSVTDTVTEPQSEQDATTVMQTDTVVVVTDTNQKKASVPKKPAQKARAEKTTDATVEQTPVETTESVPKTSNPKASNAKTGNPKKTAMPKKSS